MDQAHDRPEHANQATITGVSITPVAFKDPPLLNTVGVHEPFALRAIVEVLTDAGVSGFGETYGDAGHLARLRLAAAALNGTDIFNINELRSRIARALQQDTIQGGHGMSGMVTGSSTVDRVLSAFDVAALDIQGKLLGRPVSDLLGGAVRESVQFSGYLFYKWAGHPGQQDDTWGAALDPAGIVKQARTMVDRYGFSALKLKAGVFAPEEEIASVLALRAEFPDLPLRIDPNGAWTVETSIRVGKELHGVLEYLEDPTPGIEGMAAVRREVDMPLATNMCVVSFADVAPSVAAGAVDVILSDHHFWGGLRRTQFLAGITETFGLGLSMHSNSHLGISLAAMVHLAAATPNLDYACDTHWPWKDPSEDVIAGDVFTFKDGAVKVPTGPGLGVEVDRDALERLHRQYLDSGIRSRDDTGYMKRIHPSYELQSPPVVNDAAGVPERIESLKIVVTDPIISRFEDRLRADGGAHQWDMAAAWTPDRRLEALAGADVVVCSSLGPAEAKAAGRARLIHVTGAGCDKISFPHLVPSASVANTFHHARPIAEHVLMVTLMLVRNVRAADREVRQGQWRTIATADDVPFHPVLADLTLGLVGLGSIGAEVARIGGALGMKVRAVRRNPSAPQPQGVNLDWVGGNHELHELLATSDVVVVTVPLDSGTRGMIGAAELSAMKPSAFLINVARGPVVDEAALYAALKERRIAGAGLDVWWGSPADGVVPPADLPFASLENTVLTPHHSGHARSTFEGRAADIAANIRLLARGRELVNVVPWPAPATGPVPTR